MTNTKFRSELLKLFIQSVGILVLLVYWESAGGPGTADPEAARHVSALCFLFLASCGTVGLISKFYDFGTRWLRRDDEGEPGGPAVAEPGLPLH